MKFSCIKAAIVSHVNVAAILGGFTMMNVNKAFPNGSENLQASPVLSFGLGNGVHNDVVSCWKNLLP